MQVIQQYSPINIVEHAFYSYELAHKLAVESGNYKNTHGIAQSELCL